MSLSFIDKNFVDQILFSVFKFFLLVSTNLVDIEFYLPFKKTYHTIF